jgi:hypothetical protein
VRENKIEILILCFELEVFVGNEVWMILNGGQEN